MPRHTFVGRVAHAANMGLAKSGRTVLNQSFVLLINSSACRQFGASNARLRQAPKR